MTDTIIDMQVIQELLEIAGDDDPELLLDLIDIFLADGPTKVDRILHGLEDGDLQEIASAAHALKGSSGNLGANQLMDVSEALQTAGRTADADSVQRLVPELQVAYDAVDGALRELRARYTTQD
jgi:HPt (histidine-containing phosphotransfer) domain-containing protein